MMRRTLGFAAAFAAVVLFTGAAPLAAFGAAPLLSVEQKFAEAGSVRFGTSVSCSGNVVLVGGEGEAIVYTRLHNTWSRLQALLPQPAEVDPVGDKYGAAVDVESGIAVVGAPLNNGGAGAAYVFTRSGTTWWFTQKLQASDAQPGDHFGEAVTIDGSTIVVGAPDEDSSAKDGGAAYVFVRSATTWGETQKLTAPDGAAGDQFGLAACVEGTKLVLGAPEHATSGLPSAGAAYVYALDGTTFGTPQTLVQIDTNKSENPQAGALYGASVAVRGNTILVGASGPAGGAFAYVKPTVGAWIAQAKLPIADFGGSERYGCSVALCTDAALVGGYLEGSGRGAAAFFKRSGETWSQDRTLVGSDSVAGDDYGFSVDLYCSVAVVGAPGDGAGAGSAYFHTTLEPVPVYRFYNTRTGTHFYTDSQVERDYVWSTYSRYFAYEGVAYMTNPGNNDQPLYRFYNLKNGSHFYTASADEAESVKARLSGTYQYDGPTYFVSLAPAADKIPVYRFYNMKNGSHFYTANESERANVQAQLGNIYHFEGVAFYLGQ